MNASRSSIDHDALGPGQDYPCAMEVTYIGHAAVLVRSESTSLLMDPWLRDPAYCNSWFHYPPLVHTVDELMPVDYVWCSHDHADHFDPGTLERMPRNQKFLVPQFASGRLEKLYEKLGFSNLISLPFGEAVRLGPDLEVVCVRSDEVWEDSALVVRSDDVTLFNMNDCKLGDAQLRDIRKQHRPDIVFIPFSGAIQYPTCYGYDHTRLAQLCRSRRREHLDGFVKRVELLGAARAVPFAGNYALLSREQLWMNEPELNNINTPDEAIVALQQKLPGVEGLQMNPGDRWTLGGGLKRHQPAPDFEHKMEHIEELAEKVADNVDQLRAAEVPARTTLRSDFVNYFQDIADRHPELCERICGRVIFVAEGQNGGSWCLHFSDNGLAVSDFADGDPWNLRITMPAKLLQAAVDNDITFDELVLSFRVRFEENPMFYNTDFWVMLYNSDQQFLDAYLADTALVPIRKLGT